MVKIEKTDYAVYSLDLPLSKKSISYRTWNMKEQKRLSIAYEDKDNKVSVQEGIFQVLTNIIVDGTDVGKLPACEADYLYLQARGKSIGEFAQINLINKQSAMSKAVRIDITKVSIANAEKRNLRVPILDKNGEETKQFFMMKELTFADRIELQKMIKKDPQIVEEVELIMFCMDRICDQDNFSSVEDQKKEVREFVENLSPRQFVPFETFIDETPLIQHKIDLAQVFPGEKGFYTLTGVDDFFE